jgi:hypothetical protein
LTDRAGRGAKCSSNSTDKTGQKQWLFEPGKSGNPAGRPPGSRNKFGEDFIADYRADWAKHGAAAIAKLRQENNAVYCKLAGSLIPKEVEVDITNTHLHVDVDRMSREDIERLVYDRFGKDAPKLMEWLTSDDETDNVVDIEPDPESDYA